MNNTYEDIRSRIPEEPLRWDEYAVPRYVPFAPDHVADIYAKECVLLRIACQACEREFLIAMSYNMLDQAHGRPDLASLVRSGEIHYGDPPNVDCCPAGPTMNSIPVQVVEFWRKEKHDWQRAPDLEIAIEETEEA